VTLGYQVDTPANLLVYTEQGMDNKEKDVSEVIQGLTPVDPKALEDFKREMTDNVIPEILRVVEKRRVLAAESRQRQLKC
jgi:hypothetical protein